MKRAFVDEIEETFLNPAASKFALFVLIISLIASAFLPSIAVANGGGLSPASNAISIEAFDSGHTFPELGLIDIGNSAMLAQNISNALGLNGAPTPIWNEPRIGKELTIHRAGEEFIKDIELDTWDSKQVAYNLSAGLITLYYDNLEGNNNAFLSFRSILVNSSVLAFDAPTRASAAWSIVNALGIHSQNLTVASELTEINDSRVIALPLSDYALYENNFPSNLRDAYCDRIDLILSSEFYDMNISGANIIAFSFNNDTGQLIKVEGSLFVDLSSLTAIPVKQTLQIGRDKVPELFSLNTQGSSSGITIDKDQLIGLRRSVASDAVTGNREISLGIEYAAFISDTNSAHSWMILIVIEPGSGHVIQSWIIDLGPLSNAYIPNSWLAASIILPLSFLLIGIVVGPPELAFGILGTIFVPLYMKIRGLQVLENFNRGRIFGYISSRPGCTFTDLKKELAVLNGELAYHLMVLEKLGLIKSVKDRRNRRYFTSDAPPKIATSQRLNKMENLILAEISSKESPSTTEIAENLGTTRQRVHYNLKCLRELGIVEDTDTGWRLKTNPKTDESTSDDHAGDTSKEH
jgi:predicted transcriptional regulator